MGGPGIEVLQLGRDTEYLDAGQVGGQAGPVFQEARQPGGQTKDARARTAPMGMPTRQA